ncbi:MAG: class III signal peptide-containing protein [Methanobrevibacter sp.]|uniref:class III signal peptide-containing protein n=1 Tax=uncultured Methanobrevibacter sp. TaxID=253161 RepID=UPI0025FE4227|nr:class III signal peptide-containing protein [uncultured Methanobrevibacter sp.]MEE1128919.1 class III signal peptide-containing protein [Methanobrevibacter sp.]
MVKDNSGQVSLEYLLIFAISLIVLIVFTMPLLNQSMKTTMDVSDSLKMKSDLSKIASAIRIVYGEGQGSKQTVNINVVQPVKVNVGGEYISCNLNLNDRSNKYIKVHCKSNLKFSSITLKKGMNSIVVEWPVGKEEMIINT